MTRRFFIFMLVLLAVAASALFTWFNPDRVVLELGFARITPPISLAFVATFAAGWLFGLLCSSLWVARIARERRRLAREAARPGVA